MNHEQVGAAVATPLPAPEGDEYVLIGRSPKHGRGLYAARDLPKGTFIIEYKGEKVTRGEGNRRARKQWEKGRIYVFRLNQRFDIDGKSRGNAARLVNHSCEPNSESQNERGRRVWVVATRDIQEGEEITYDYHLDFEEPPAECRCGSKECIGYMVGPEGHQELHDWLVENGREVPAPLTRRLKAMRKKTSRPAAKKRTAPAGTKRTEAAGTKRTAPASTRRTEATGTKRTAPAGKKQKPAA